MAPLDFNRTSQDLAIGEIYTRVELRNLFDIHDATLNNGIFRPKGWASIWLFITEEKTSDRTQYRDRLEGDTLYTQGQTAGRTDHLIIGHEAAGLELLVFFRRNRYEYPGAGFRFLGPFVYSKHSGTDPTSFVLKRSTSFTFPADEIAAAPFDPANAIDGRRRILRSIAERRGQRAFREALLKAYDSCCAISGCKVLAVLEAAHIFPYLGAQTNDVSNGLLLRTDLHTLFDCGLITIDPTSYAVSLDSSLRNTEYGALDGVPIRLPQKPSYRPSAAALLEHRRTSSL